jgi:ABC-type amino acid transport system permease subunit
MALSTPSAMTLSEVKMAVGRSGRVSRSVVTAWQSAWLTAPSLMNSSGRSMPYSRSAPAKPVMRSATVEMGIAPTSSTSCCVYTDIFRGLPAIVTILLIGQGLAQVGRTIFGPTPYPLGILALSLIAGAYTGEIFRAGIQSVDKGQLDACRALGMSYGKAMRLVVVPQGIRRVLPALVNQFIGNIKDSSLVYFLGLLTAERELFRIGQDAAVNSGNLSPLVMAGIFYLMITVPLTHLVNFIDARMRRGRKISSVSSGLNEVSELQNAELATVSPQLVPATVPAEPVDGQSHPESGRTT